MLTAGLPLAAILVVFGGVVLWANASRFAGILESGDVALDSGGAGLFFRE